VHRRERGRRARERLRRGERDGETEIERGGRERGID
jgi:hypothetical protein